MASLPPASSKPSPAPSNLALRPFAGSGKQPALHEDIQNFRRALGGEKKTKPSSSSKRGDSSSISDPERHEREAAGITRRGGQQNKQGQNDSNKEQTQKQEKPTPTSMTGTPQSIETKHGGVEPVDPQDAAAYVQAMAQQPPGLAAASSSKPMPSDMAIRQAAVGLVAELTARTLISHSGGETTMRVELSPKLLPGVSVEMSRAPSGAVEMVFTAASPEVAGRLTALQEGMRQAITSQTGKPVQIAVQTPDGDVAGKMTGAAQQQQSHEAMGDRRARPEWELFDEEPNR